MRPSTWPAHPAAWPIQSIDSDGRNEPRHSRPLRTLLSITLSFLHLPLKMRPTASMLRQSTTVSAASSSSRSFSRQAVAKALSVAASSTPKPRRSYASAASPIHTGSLVKTSTLPNGVRVATESTPGHFSAVGVYVDAGSRFERPWVSGESGVSHLLDRMAFKSTSNRSSEQMTSEIEKLGGQVMCSSSRETIMYQ